MGWKLSFTKHKLEHLNRIENESSEFKSQNNYPVTNNPVIIKLKFNNATNSLQKIMYKDIAIIKQSDKIIVNSDKTRNHYEIDVDTYHDVIIREINKNYKKASQHWKFSINSEKKSAKELKFEDRIYKLHKQQTFITVKDNKASLPHNRQYRLINSSTNNIWRISKKILQRACKYTIML